MPIYEYFCDACGTMEAIQKMSDEPLKECPKCGKTENFQKVISRSAFHLKGSGWYKSDYPSSSSESKTKDASPAPVKSCGSGCGCH